MAKKKAVASPKSANAKPNMQDATLRNIRSLKRRVATLEMFVTDLRKRVDDLEVVNLGLGRAD